MHELLEAACEHRQEKLALQKRVKTLEQDLAVAKQACKDQEYHIAQVSLGGADVSVAGRSAGEEVGVDARVDAGCAEARVDLERGMLSWDLEMPLWLFIGKGQRGQFWGCLKRAGWK
jgi:hypothetical protein